MVTAPIARCSAEADDASQEDRRARTSLEELLMRNIAAMLGLTAALSVARAEVA